VGPGRCQLRKQENTSWSSSSSSSLRVQKTSSADYDHPSRLKKEARVRERRIRRRRIIKRERTRNTQRTRQIGKVTD
jgi:hypothetical protein